MSIARRLGELPLIRKLPRTATAPFCPSEVSGSVEIPEGVPTWRKILAFAGPGLLVSVGYMDPGNWATDIEAGSRYGYAFLSIVLFSSLTAIVLQCLSFRVGVVSGRDLAQLCRARYSRSVNLGLWILAELAIIATDVAEVLGSALAFYLLFSIPLRWGIPLTALDTLIVLGLKGKGIRRLEAVILGLVATIGICYFVELGMLDPPWHLVFRGFLPAKAVIDGPAPLYLAIGILGATVMPHNLYLHSSIIQTRKVGADDRSKRTALRFATLDTIFSLFLAFFVNAAILVLAASAFNATGHTAVTEIDDAYRLLQPIVGNAYGGVLFGIALLASGQSSTFTGTIAGQVLMEGFLDLKIPCWQRRVITRSLALAPAFLGIWILGDHGVGRLLVISQVVLSFQLPFAILPLILCNRDEKIMDRFRIGPLFSTTAFALFAIITVANAVLVYQWGRGT